VVVLTANADSTDANTEVAFAAIKRPVPEITAKHQLSERAVAAAALTGRAHQPFTIRVTTLQTAIQRCPAANSPGQFYLPAYETELHYTYSSKI